MSITATMISPKSDFFVSPKNETTIMPKIDSVTPKNDPLSTRQQPSFTNEVDLNVVVTKLQPDDLKRYAEDLKKFCRY